ncbi:hypothetical protein CRUP_031423 [Coryphaenoides rupestris]|nr:hypothetical protein CRUP_031423 [Coryphaenoides rupestris]
MTPEYANSTVYHPLSSNVNSKIERDPLPSPPRISGVQKVTELPGVLTCSPKEHNNNNNNDTTKIKHEGALWRCHGAPPPTTAEPGSGVVFVPQIAVTAASPLPMPRDRGEEQTRARPRDPTSGPRTPADNHDHVTTGHGIPQDHEASAFRGVFHWNDDDDDADGNDDEGHLDLHSVSEGEECATPRASRQNFIELMMDRSAPGATATPPRWCPPATRTAPPPAPRHTLDPLEHEWMMCASDAEWDGLSGLLAGEPAAGPEEGLRHGLHLPALGRQAGQAGAAGAAGELSPGATPCPWTSTPGPARAATRRSTWPPMHNHAEVVKLLVGSYDADVELRDYSGKKASQYLPDIMEACGGGGFGGSDDSDGTPADAQPVGRARRESSSRTLKPLRLLGHSKSDVGGARQRGSTAEARQGAPAEARTPALGRTFDRQKDEVRRAEEDAHAFLDKELKKLWSILFLHYPQCSESQREEEVGGKKEEQRRRAIEGVVDITKLCLMEMNQEDLADALRSGRESRTDASDVLSELRVKFSLMFVLFQRAEEDAHVFLDKELKKLWSVLFLHYPQCSESQREEEEEVVDGKKKEQRRRAIEGGRHHQSSAWMEMNQEELAGHTEELISSLRLRARMMVLPGAQLLLS